MDRLSPGRETEVGVRMETYGHAAVSTNDGDDDGRSQRELSELLSDKSRSTDNVQSGDAKEPNMR